MERYGETISIHGQMKMAKEAEMPEKVALVTMVTMTTSAAVPVASRAAMARIAVMVGCPWKLLRQRQPCQN